MRERADENAHLVFQAQRDVVFDLLEVAPGGWLHVRHRDGVTGFIRVTQVLGA